VLLQASLTGADYHGCLTLVTRPYADPGSQGPTLTMRVHQYALMRDVAASQPRPRSSAAMFAAPPLLVMNQVLTPCPRHQQTSAASLRLGCARVPTAVAVDGLHACLGQPCVVNLSD